MNRLAASLHPARQYVKIASVTHHGDAKSFVLIPDREKGTEKLAYFRASQYVSVELNIGGALVNKPYTIRLKSKDALGEESSYTLTISSPSLPMPQSISWTTGRKGTACA